MTLPAGVAVRFDRTSVVFGNRPGRALPLMDEGRSRAEIHAATGQILGVHDCTLDVAAGETLVLMGLSGSGKSTLLRAVNGLSPVCRGSVQVNLGDWTCTVGSARAAELRRLRRHGAAMVFQHFALLPWRTVADNVGLGLELAGVPARERRARVAAQLDRVGLAHWAGRRVGDLSGGMQQRVGLARALATEAPILLMDEPFSALDPLIRARLQDDLIALQATLGRTILFVSHDLDEAFRIGNRIALMEGGRIVQTGTARQIIAAPASAYVAAFVAHMNPLAFLTAGDVMVPVPGLALPSLDASVGPDLPLRDLIARMGGRAALPVVEGGRILGMVTADGVLARLARARVSPPRPEGSPPGADAPRAG